MIVIADEPINRALPETIEQMLAPVSDSDALVIFVERTDRRNARQACIGLDDALRNAPDGKPIIMLGWFSPLHHADNPRWHAAMGHPNVAFRRLPVDKNEILSGLEEASAEKRAADPLAIALLGAVSFQREMGILQHDLHHAEQSADRMVAWEERARKHLGDKPQAELIEIVKRARPQDDALGQFDGREFPDVCVDVEGTLFNEQREFRPDVLARARELAEGRPITIWTGGDLKTAREMVRKASIPYKLVAKQQLRGATVGIVVDDLPKEEFSKTYGIGHSKEYVRV